MPFDAFLKIPEIPGESFDAEHRDSIEISSYHFGAHQSISTSASTAGGATAGRVMLSHFTFSKVLDKASNKLFEASCNGTDIPNATLTIHGAGGDKLKYYEVILEQVIVADYTQLAGDGELVETVQLNYGKIKTVYTQQKRSDGKGGGNIAAGWDRINNCRYA